MHSAYNTKTRQICSYVCQYFLQTLLNTSYIFITSHEKSTTVYIFPQKTNRACSLVTMAYTSTEQAVNIYQYSWGIINSLNHLINKNEITLHLLIA